MQKFFVMAILVCRCVLPCQAALDADGDGISDLWQQIHPGLAPDGDEDGDGFTNAQEAVAGTDPLDSKSLLRVKEFGRDAENGRVFFQWQGVAGKMYMIERYDPQSGVWSVCAESFSETNSLRELDFASPEPSGIFRLRVRDHDGDSDGLSAWEEAMLGFSDESAASSGQHGRNDYAAAFRMLEGSGMLELAEGVEVPQRPTSRAEASRFLAQASFGADAALIDYVASVGIGGWLDGQLDPAVKTWTSQTMTAQGGAVPLLWAKGWWRAVMTGPDQLRQRMAYALSQILVISCAGNDAIRGNSPIQADYYDILLQHALGNYRHLLEDVTYSTQMGFYLSHLQNRKSDPSIGRFPDENFAREIMQLFTIGLWELNPDGTRRLDATGEPIPTYDNATIMEMAKVFTGFGFGGPSAHTFFTPVNGTQYVHPMKMWNEEHEPGEKHIVGGVTIPAGQTGAQDISDALDALCAHPNIGPFLSRLLIQRFTSSNPGPDYVRRVAAVWDDNGSGERGDLKAVAEAILLDPEARTPVSSGDASGKVREPYLRLAAVLRAFKARNAKNSPTFPVWTGDFPRDFGQQPLWAPSVFNFYLPDHRPAGEMRNRGLVSPELEIGTADRLIATDNYFKRSLEVGLHADPNTEENRVRCDFSYEQSIAGNAAALVGHLDELLTHGMMSASTKAAIVAAVHAQTTPELKVQTAVHLISQSPDFVVLK